MKNKLKGFGILICSAGLLALPAAAQSRWNGNRNNSTPQYSAPVQQYSASMQQYSAPAQQYSAPAQNYGQRYNSNTPSYGQSDRGSSNYGYGYGDDRERSSYRNDYRDWRSERRHYRWDRWDWR